MKILSLKSCPGLSKVTKPRKKKNIDPTEKTVRQILREILICYWGIGCHGDM